ncbi:ThuA domain-containing protein [Histidinibacterium aquaticum]|uniref:Trehalose utilization protein ThuA n=1 Tax=Histidinibacterium aquaticum TaxID=2613962 RepID=A0A5J5GG34_9RHOB|nr:ThuA domain-containing protein [Histidinibacterium aquaticum]KAA9006738.1 trehalose utilization protein ThuA [Histidinibacterium aquaticum]
MPIRALVWNENVHERTNETVAKQYPDGIHGAVASALAESEGVEVSTATLQEPEQGLSEERLAGTDVLFWWGHAHHGDVTDETTERVMRHVWSGMGFVALHSAHFSKPFKGLMGTPCNLSWREAGEKERIWTVAPSHPLAEGLPPFFELEPEEMYGEPFGIPEPEETVFVSWFEGGEVFRSGATWRRGGRVVYFRPGHETYPSYHDANVRQVLRNAARYAAGRRVTTAAESDAAPNVPASEAPEPFEARGPRLHKDGEAGFR